EGDPVGGEELLVAAEAGLRGVGEGAVPVEQHRPQRGGEAHRRTATQIPEARTARTKNDTTANVQSRSRARPTVTTATRATGGSIRSGTPQRRAGTGPAPRP